MCLHKGGKHIQQWHWYRCKVIAICLEQNQALASALQLPTTPLAPPPPPREDAPPPACTTTVHTHYAHAQKLQQKTK